MSLTQEQLEWIVSEVVRRLRDQPAAMSSVSSNELTLSERLVTTETLQGRIDGVRKVSVAKRAVVTPSAIDLLKEKQIEFVRVT